MTAHLIAKETSRDGRILMVHANASIGAEESGHEVVVDGPNYVIEQFDGTTGQTSSIELRDKEVVRTAREILIHWFMTPRPVEQDDDEEDDDA